MTPGHEYFFLSARGLAGHHINCQVKDVQADPEEEENIPAEVSYRSIASTIKFDKKDNRQ